MSKKDRGRLRRPLGCLLRGKALRSSSTCGVCGGPKPLAGACRPCSNRRNREYKAREVERIREARAEYKKRRWAEGAAARLAAKEQRRATLPARRGAAKRAWKQSNKGVVNASTAKRFATKLRATPLWSNPFFVEEAYVLAALRTQLLGFKWHVDHIVPLRSPLVCGLHCEQNLRVVPAVVNMSKSNRVWPDMPNT